MKRIAAILILISLVTIFPSFTYASDNLIKPNSPFYFLQTWGEEIKLFFTFPKEEKLNYLLELTEKRIEEVKITPSTNTFSRYENHFRQLDELAIQVENKDQAVEKIKTTSLHQQEVLAQVYLQTPDQAKKAIIDVQENSSKHVARTIEAVEGNKKAQEYIVQVARIQQAERMGQTEQVELSPMEGSPNTDPGQFTPQEIKETHQLKEGQPLNPLNPVLENSENEGGNIMEPAAPVQINQPVGQN